MSDKVYSIVTEKVLELLDNGVVPWRKPWATKGGDIPKNAWDKPYRGINTFLLAFERSIKGYKSNTWMTFKQVGERGGKVNENEKSTLVIFWKILKVADKSVKSGVKSIPLLRYFQVFNLDQTTGVKLTKKQTASLVPDDAVEFESVDDAEAILATYLASDDAPSFNENGGNRASYSPTFDAISIPARTSFSEAGGYFSTAFHEIGHSTGHASRCKREGVDNFDHFGSGQYAKEELVAELTGAFLCAESGIDNTLDNSASYIASWKKRLQDDPKLIVSAAGAAQKAADYVLGTTFEKRQEVAA